jgi:hypothetical protein
VITDSGGVSRAIGIGFIERAFGYWAHPWQLRAPEGPAPEATVPVPPASTVSAPATQPSATGPVQDGVPAEAAIPFDPGGIRRAIETGLAAYGPEVVVAQGSSSANRVAAQSGAMAPALSFREPTVRIVDPRTIEVAGYVTLGELDIGPVTATVTPAGNDMFSVAVKFDRSRWQLDDCVLNVQDTAFNLSWDGRLDAFSGLDADFGPIEGGCRDLNFSAADLRVESTMSEDGDLWDGRLIAALQGLKASEPANQNDLRLEEARFQIDFRGFDFDRRARVLASLPPRYWPRHVAFLGAAFDVTAAGSGAIPDNLAEQYASDTSTMALEASLSGLNWNIDDGYEPIAVNLAQGEISADTAAPAHLSYRHDGLSVDWSDAAIDNPWVALPSQLGLQVALDSDAAVPVVKGLSSMASDQDLMGFLQDLGSVKWQLQATQGQSSADTKGEIWVKPGQLAPFASATVVSNDPAGLLLGTVLKPLSRRGRATAVKRDLQSAILEIARIVPGASGPQYRFDVTADLGGSALTVNGLDTTTVVGVFANFCAKYSC